MTSSASKAKSRTPKASRQPRSTLPVPVEKTRWTSGFSAFALASGRAVASGLRLVLRGCVASARILVRSIFLLFYWLERFWWSAWIQRPLAWIGAGFIALFQLLAAGFDRLVAPYRKRRWFRILAAILAPPLAFLGLAAETLAWAGRQTFRHPGLATLGATGLAALAFLLTQPPMRETAVAFNQDDVSCLALNIYHEARGEPLPGKRAVAHVVLNRARHWRFPDDICDVVKQGGEEKRHACQFSWWCDGRSDQPQDRVAWRESLSLAKVILDDPSTDPTDGALWYHAIYVEPDWSTRLAQGPQIGRHVFYHEN